MSNHHVRDFRLRYDDVDGRAEAKPETILNLLEESAASHCDESGWGIFRLLSEGFGWVLLRGSLEMFRYPAYRESVRVDTWASSARRVQAEREYRILSTQGEVLGEARSRWLFCDLGKRRPATIFPDIMAIWRPSGELSSPLPLDEIDGPTSPPPSELPRPVRQSEIDTNGHVNNVVYLAWGLDALPPELREGKRLRRIAGQFKREIGSGAQSLPFMVREGEGEYRMGVYGSAGGETWLAAAATTHWEDLALASGLA